MRGFFKIHANGGKDEPNSKPSLPSGIGIRGNATCKIQNATRNTYHYQSGVFYQNRAYNYQKFAPTPRLAPSKNIDNNHQPKP
jgi:hypothetical protein